MHVNRALEWQKTAMGFANRLYLVYAKRANHMLVLILRAREPRKERQ